MDTDVNGLGSLPDEDLVKLTQAGSNPAFSELMRRHYPSCMKVAQSILRDREDAEDEVQNACWKAYSHIGQFQYDAKFSTWLTRIVVNQCLMRLRQIKRARSTYIEDWTAGEDMVAIEPRDQRDTPEMDLGRREVMEVVRQEIAGIPPLLRNVFVLRDVEELPMPAVAEQLGISVAAAKSRLLRARSEFRNRLLRHFSKLGPSSLIAS